MSSTIQSAAVVVAHPDDETLWAGGTILMHPQWRWTVGCLCRSADADRSPKFHRVLARLGASGKMANLDDGPEQSPLPEALVAETVLSVLPGASFDVILTHSPFGEYTRHLRHEQAGRAVLSLWENGELAARELWMFAYEDGGRKYPPRAIKAASRVQTLPERIWEEKSRLITEIYGYGPCSFEVITASPEEAFWCFSSPAAARKWLNERGEAR